MKRSIGDTQYSSPGLPLVAGLGVPFFAFGAWTAGARVTLVPGFVGWLAGTNCW